MTPRELERALGRTPRRRVHHQGRRGHAGDDDRRRQRRPRSRPQRRTRQGCSARFYRDIFIPSWPDDLEQTPTNRVVGDGQIVDEIRTRFTHDRPMEWFLPGVPPTHKPVDIDIIVVVQFRDNKIACERIYWDQATVLRQVGLLAVHPPHVSPGRTASDNFGHA